MQAQASGILVGGWGRGKERGLRGGFGSPKTPRSKSHCWSPHQPTPQPPPRASWEASHCCMGAFPALPSVAVCRLGQCRGDANVPALPFKLFGSNATCSHHSWKGLPKCRLRLVLCRFFLHFSSNRMCTPALRTFRPFLSVSATCAGRRIRYRHFCPSQMFSIPDTTIFRSFLSLNSCSFHPWSS